MNDATVWALPAVWGQSPYVELTLSTLRQWAAWLLVGFFGVFPGIVAYMVWGERRSPRGSRTGSARTGSGRSGSCSRSPTRSS